MQYHIVFNFLLQPSKTSLQKLADLYLSLPQLCCSEIVDERGKRSLLSKPASDVRQAGVAE